MVRRDEARRAAKPRDEASRCASPAGESPVPVSARAPGSRPQVSEGDLRARAGRQEPSAAQAVGGEQARGPQHQVKPAASTERQSGGRAAHFTAKATPKTRSLDGVGGPGGVWGAARVQGEGRNTRDPSARPSSGQGEPYKAKPKSAAAQRESEGTVVPVMVATNNAAGGKGPWSGHVEDAGKRKGMAAKSGPNDPGGRRPRDNVRLLQRRLWVAAKREPGRRFHALYDHLSRRDVLERAWERVKANKGAAGVDRETISDVEQYGVKLMLQELGDALRKQEYRA